MSEESFEDLVCENCPCCNHDKGWFDNQYQCHIDPPQYCGEDDNKNAYWGFPGVDADDWCWRGRQIMLKGRKNDT